MSGDGGADEMGTYWRAYADELADRLTANGRIDAFTKNSDLVGAYAEASVTRLVQSMVAPYRCSTGSVIGKDVGSDADLKQLDLIVWDPAPLPAIFDEGGFALVPNQSVLGVLEIKRSLYSGAGVAMQSTLDWVEERVEGHRTAGTPVVELLRHQQVDTAAELLASPEGWKPDPFHLALGVVCLRKDGQTDAVADALVGEGRAVVLQSEDETGAIQVSAGHVLHLVEFARQIRVRASKKLPTDGVSPAKIAQMLGEDSPGSLRRDQPD